MKFTAGSVVATALLLHCIAGSCNVQAANILAVFPFPGRSQYIFAENYLKQLAIRGHNVTVINTFGDDVKQTNFHVIGATKVHELMAAFTALGYTAQASQWEILDMTTKFLNMLSTCLLNDAAVQQLLQSKAKFDLVIMETVQTEVLFGLAQHFNASMLGISSYGTDQHIDELMGNISPLSYTPMLLSSRTEHMNFEQRLLNVWEACVNWLHKRLVHLPSQLQLYQQYFPHAQSNLHAAMNSFSLMLLGQHFSLSYARPYLPNMIEVAGLHLQQQLAAAELPHSIAEFVAEATHGVIYFSMGSNIKSADLPESVKKVLLQTFASLPQRVLWKFEAEQLLEKPSNVLINKWFPQMDILAHANVKLFITHGGLLSTIESVYHGKPVLGLPVFYDQHLNIERAKQAGYGLGLNLWTANSTQLREHIMELLQNDSYAAAAQLKSKLYRDQKETPLERAIWWTEYVLRHKGAQHLRAAARDLHFWQLHSLDTWSVLGVAAILSMLAVWLILRLIYKALCWCPLRFIGGKKTQKLKSQ